MTVMGDDRLRIRLGTVFVNVETLDLAFLRNA
jgi:hypothetical protein